MKKTIFNLSFLACTGIAGVILLFSFSERINRKRGGFIRLIPPHTVLPVKIIDLEVNSYVIAGVTSSHIYLGNISLPTHLLISNFDLSDTSHLDLEINQNKKTITYKSPHVKVDSPLVYIIDGAIPQIFAGEINNSVLKRYNLKNMRRFSLPLFISPTTIISRVYDADKDQNVLSSYNFADGLTNDFPNLLQRQQDGIFSTDGMLTFDRSLNRVVYLYYYRNDFLNLDTNMKIISTGNTIDTNTVAKITIAEVASTKTTTLSAPPLLVNKSCYADDGKLYIQSGLMADNENPKSFKDCSVIDVYSLANNRYLFSFYIPDLYSQKVKSFSVHNNFVVAMYDHYAESFKLNTSRIKAMMN